jgi:hypothetical protein
MMLRIAQVIDVLLKALCATALMLMANSAAAWPTCVLGTYVDCQKVFTNATVNVLGSSSWDNYGFVTLVNIASQGHSTCLDPAAVFNFDLSTPHGKQAFNLLLTAKETGAHVELMIFQSATVGSACYVTQARILD